MQPQNRAARAQSEAKIARVSVSDAEGFGTVNASETRGILLAVPRGVDSMPCEGDRVLLHSAGGTQVCAGALCNTQGLAPGEVRLRSAGGACTALPCCKNIQSMVQCEQIQGMKFSRGVCRNRF